MKIIDAHAHVVQCIAGFTSRGELRSAGGEVGIIDCGGIMRVQAFAVLAAVIDAQHAVAGRKKAVHKAFVEFHARLEEHHDDGKTLRARREGIARIDDDALFAHLSAVKQNVAHGDAFLLRFGNDLFAQRQRIVEILP